MKAAMIAFSLYSRIPMPSFPWEDRDRKNALHFFPLVGCAAGIVEKTVREMVRLLGARPERILAALGPCIGKCCFETDSDVPEAMRTSALGAEAEPYLERRGEKWHVDLAGLNRQWLLRAGVAPDHIDVCGLCTACRPDLFWSHRKMGEARGVQAAVISL